MKHLRKISKLYLRGFAIQASPLLFFLFREKNTMYYEKESLEKFYIQRRIIMCITTDGLVVTYEEFLDLVINGK